MNPILMAAARGARIELRHFNEQIWYRAYSIDVNGGSAAIDGTYRIHPDDEHLRFGPISTALREAAKTDETNGFIFSVSPGSFWLAHSDAVNLSCVGYKRRSLFLLILSEALADSGL